MKLFVIRNLFSIVSAEEIIKSNNIDNYVFLIPTTNDEYFSKLKKNITIKYSEVIHYKESIYPKLKKIIFNKFSIDRKEDRIKKILSEFRVDSIFLTNLDDCFEKHLAYIALSENITLNLFEEGTNFYFNNLIYSNLKTFINKICLRIFPKKYKFYFQQEKFKIKVDNIFCYFPEAYKFKNYKQIIKIKNNFLKESSSKEKIENLLLTRPLSEDNLLEENQEIEIILNYLIKYKIKEVHFKPHPRENIEKIKKIIRAINNLNIKCISIVDDIPVEKIFYKYNIGKIIGYETGSLVYLSELANVECDSLIKTVVEKTQIPYFKNYYEFYKENFKKINYV